MTLYKADITDCGVNMIPCRHKPIVVLLLILLIHNTVLAIGDTFDKNLMQLLRSLSASYKRVFP